MTERILNYLSVRCGDQWYGIAVDQIVEVFHLVAFTELRDSKNGIRGMITVRNEVMTVLDLRSRLGLKDLRLNMDMPMVAIHTMAGSIALLVDDTAQVEEIPESKISVPKNIQELPYVRAIAQLAEQLLPLLDIDSLVNP